MAVTESAWTPASWQQHEALQQPVWPDAARAEIARAELRGMPPLVFAGEARALRDSLAEVAAGRAFLLQAGDCAESFHDTSAVTIREKLRILLQMSVVLTYAAALPVVKVGRIAGQFAKPRSATTERIGDVDLPSFYGHLINDDAPTAEARVHDPQRMLRAYDQSARTLNLLRAFSKGGFADITRVHEWNQEFVASSAEGRRYEQVASEIERALRFMTACGIDLAREAQLHQVDVWTSHEGLVLDYEEGLTRRDSLTGDWYDCSAHMLWIGERTRRPDGAHAAFFAGVHNPIGVKVGPAATPQELVELCAKLDPDRTPGRLTLIARMGSAKVREHAAAAPARGRGGGAPGGVGLRSDARQRHPHRIRPQDAPLRRDHGRARGIRRRLPQRGHVAGRGAPGVHGRGRHRMPRRCRGSARGTARNALHDALRPALERPPVARPGLPPGRVDARRCGPA